MTKRLASKPDTAMRRRAHMPATVSKLTVFGALSQELQRRRLRTNHVHRVTSQIHTTYGASDTIRVPTKELKALLVRVMGSAKGRKALDAVLEHSASIPLRNRETLPEALYR